MTCKTTVKHSQNRKPQMVKNLLYFKFNTRIQKLIKTFYEMRLSKFRLLNLKTSEATILKLLHQLQPRCEASKTKIYYQTSNQM